MTKVKVFKKGSDFTRITCDGHTGYGVEGEDIVCAALSSIVQTASLGMLSVAGANIHIKRNDKEGFFEIIIPEQLPDNVAHDVQVIFATMMCGITDLHEEYSDCIDLEVCDVL